MGFESLEQLELNPTEYCFVMEDTPSSSSTFKVFIPKLLPSSSYNVKPVITKEIMSNSIFINDPSNKPSTSNIISVQNFITLKRFKNCWFRFAPSTILQGTRLVCKIIDNNIRNIGLIDDEFNTQYTDTSKSVYIRNPSFDILDKVNTGDRIRYFNGLSASDGTVTSKYEWGVIVSGMSITPDKIIGLYKKPGEYSLNY